MLLAAVRARDLARGQPIVNVPPVIGTGISWIDADLFDRIDQFQHPLDPGPARNSEETLTARPHIGDRREAFAASDSSENVDPRDDGAKVPGRPPDVGDDAVGREAQNAAPPIEDLLPDISAEADPVLDLLLMPDQFDVGERALMEARGAHDASLSSFPPSRRRPTSEELDSWKLDSELGEPEAVGVLDEFGRSGS